MVIEEVITALEKHLRKDSPKVILILHKVKEPCRLPAFRKIVYNLICKHDSKDTGDSILEVSNTFRVTSDKEETDAEYTMNQEFMMQLFDNYGSIRNRAINKD